MTITWPMVIFLNHLKSSGKCHGILFPAPMTRLSDMAAIALKDFMSLWLARLLRGDALFVFFRGSSNGNRRFYAGMRIVVQKLKIFVFEIVDVFDGWIELHL